METHEQNDHFNACGRAVQRKTRSCVCWQWHLMRCAASRDGRWCGASASAHCTPAAQEDPAADDHTKDKLHKHLVQRTLEMIRPARFTAEAWVWPLASSCEMDIIARPDFSHLPVSFHSCSVHIYHRCYRLKTQAKIALLNDTCTATTACTLIPRCRILLFFLQHCSSTDTAILVACTVSGY